MQSLDRALDVLEAVAAGGELGVSEVAARTGLVVSTTHRLLASLADRGYVRQSSAHGRYALGLKVLELARGMQARTAALCVAARPHLERVRQATGESANLVVLDGDRVVYVDQVAGRHSVRMFTELGSSVPAHTTGSGKAMLAFWPAETVATLYPRAREPLPRLTARTHTTLASLRDDFARIRRRGYALDDEEHEEGVSCVAAPVFRRRGHCVRGDQRLGAEHADRPRGHRRDRRARAPPRRRDIGRAGLRCACRPPTRRCRLADAGRRYVPRRADACGGVFGAARLSSPTMPMGGG